MNISNKAVQVLYSGVEQNHVKFSWKSSLLEFSLRSQMTHTKPNLYKNTWDLCPSGCPREHKPLHYAMLKLRKSYFGMSGSMGRGLLVFRS